MFAGKPIIGIIGGIGSGKSFVANLFGQLGCLVINSDDQISQAYRLPHVRDTLLAWWGSHVFNPDNTLNRHAVAAKIFNDPDQRRRLQDLLYPIIASMRDQTMRAAANDPNILAYLWDAPLLVEAGLNAHCDAIVFVDAPPEIRLERVRLSRGWDAHELHRREKLQLALDKKREIANHIVRNTADAGNIRNQVREVLSRILAETSGGGQA